MRVSALTLREMLNEVIFLSSLSVHHFRCTLVHMFFFCLLWFSSISSSKISHLLNREGACSSRRAGLDEESPANTWGSGPFRPGLAGGQASHGASFHTCSFGCLSTF